MLVQKNVDVTCTLSQFIYDADHARIEILIAGMGGCTLTNPKAMAVGRLGLTRPTPLALGRLGKERLYALPNPPPGKFFKI